MYDCGKGLPNNGGRSKRLVDLYIVTGHSLLNDMRITYFLFLTIFSLYNLYLISLHLHN